MWGKSQDEPVILTLSSDEEDNSLSGASSEKSASYVPINSKEPVIIPRSGFDDCVYHHTPKSDKCCTSGADVNSPDYFISLLCRNIRIGSLKTIPKHRVVLSRSGLKFSLCKVASGKTQTDVEVQFNSLIKVLAHFGNGIPVIFFYMTDRVGHEVRSTLGMENADGYFFDPCSREESQKRITLLLERVKQTSVDVIKEILNVEVLDTSSNQRWDLLEELSQQEANTILARSSTSEGENCGSRPTSNTFMDCHSLIVYPPPPSKGGITVTVDDYCCLKDEQFLNDVLIDFYLKWLQLCELSERDREKTHIFSTFFYKRLTSKPKMVGRRSLASAEDSSLTAAERRHARVKSWTKNVDIFTKDFLIIPINEDSHWFLVVICFPGLKGPVTADGVAIPASDAASRRMKRKRKKPERIPLIGDDEGEGSDRDEAEGEESELEDLYDDGDDRNCSLKGKNVKQPCILVLDSLGGTSRSSIVSTLRGYLTVEYKLRKKANWAFNRDTMPGACPKVPQQMNFSDCGLFVLQFAQSFFKKPLQDFALPIRSLRKWFNQDEVGCKRESVAFLIRSLMKQQRPNNPVRLPSLFPNSESEQFGNDLESPPPSKQRDSPLSEGELKDELERENECDMVSDVSYGSKLLEKVFDRHPKKEISLKLKSAFSASDKSVRSPLSGSPKSIGSSLSGSPKSVGSSLSGSPKSIGPSLSNSNDNCNQSSLNNSKSLGRSPITISLKKNARHSLNNSSKSGLQSCLRNSPKRAASPFSASVKSSLSGSPKRGVQSSLRSSPKRVQSPLSDSPKRGVQSSLRSSPKRAQSPLSGSPKSGVVQSSLSSSTRTSIGSPLSASKIFETLSNMTKNCSNKNSSSKQGNAPKSFWATDADQPKAPSKNSLNLLQENYSSDSNDESLDDLFPYLNSNSKRSKLEESVMEIQYNNKGNTKR